MSLQAFGKPPPGSLPPGTDQTNEINTSAKVQQMLDENTHFIECIQSMQKQGNMSDMMKYQEKLHRNLIHLTKIAETEKKDKIIINEKHRAGEI